MFNKQIDYEALWDEIENELDTDVTIEEFQNPTTILPSSHKPYSSPCSQLNSHPLHFIFFPHRRNYY
jgi:hypothetical protein